MDLDTVLWWLAVGAGGAVVAILTKVVSVVVWRQSVRRANRDLRKASDLANKALEAEDMEELRTYTTQAEELEIDAIARLNYLARLRGRRLEDLV